MTNNCSYGDKFGYFAQWYDQVFVLFHSYFSFFGFGYSLKLIFLDHFNQFFVKGQKAFDLAHKFDPGLDTGIAPLESLQT